MAYTTINKPADYFNTVLYTGDGTTSNAITGVGFSPEFCWLKSRSITGYHGLFDIVRGTNNWLFSNATDAELTTSNGLGSFDADGFTIGDNSNINTNSATNVAWNWLAGGTASSNTDGSITSSVSASTTSGFSIVSYTGTGANATVGHGLSSAPKMILFKNTNSVRDWGVYHGSLSDPDNYLTLNQSYAQTTGFNFSNNTAPTSSVFSVGTLTNNNGSSQNYIAYCFSEVKGFSKFGSYTGVLSPGATALGSPFVYTGFKPAMVILKSSSHVEHWHLKDAKRDPFNYVSKALYANLSDAEGTITNNGGVDFYSNGFGINYGTGDIGSSGKTYIYMAFAENPLVTSGGTPATAR